MLSVTNLISNRRMGNEALRYGHTAVDVAGDCLSATPRPVTVWAVTKACNLRCVHCYASADACPAPNELSHDEAITLLDDLRRFGVPAVLFSGGEPLIRPDALDLIGYARSVGLNATLSTNGLLIDDSIADRLAQIGLRYVGISLDGIGPMHDKLRGMRGAFDQSLAAIDRCVARGIKVGVRFTVHALNRGDLRSIVDLCVEHGVQRLCVYHLAYAGRAGKMQKADLTGEQTREVVDEIFRLANRLCDEGRMLEVLTVSNHADAAYALLRLERDSPERVAWARALLRGTGGNRSGCNIAAIDPVGGVHYDQFSWHYTCGNVRQRPFSEIWTDARDPRLAVLRDRKASLPHRCRGCRYLEVCNGNLRTRAESATGDWLGLDPACYLTDEEIAAPQGFR